MRASEIRIRREHSVNERAPVAWLGDDVGVLAASCTIGHGIVLRVVYNLTAVLFLPIKAVYLLGMDVCPDRQST